jgi:hypothetical protein
MAPVVLVLGNMAVQVTSALIRKQLMKLGFKAAKNYKKYSNVTKVTRDNAANVLNKAQKLSDELRPSSRDLAKKPKIIRRKPDEKPPQAQTSVPKTNRTVNAKFDKSQKLSRFQNAGKPSTTTSPGTTTPFTRIKTGKRTSPVAPTAVSAAGERPTIDSKPLPKGPKVSSSSPKQPGYPRTGPKADKPLKNKPTGESKATRSGVLMLMASEPSGLGSGKSAMLEIAREAGFRNIDKAPPPNALKKVVRPKAKPAVVKKQLSAFGSAFKKARADKEYSFTFKDKKYTTRYKEETVAEHKKKFQKKKK